SAEQESESAKKSEDFSHSNWIQEELLPTIDIIEAGS
ncbi:unnamed protein product, partial [marine sediment metagenome]